LQKMRRHNRKSTIGSGNYFRAAGEVPQWNWEYGSQQHDET
jgi:hypothetical protein